MFNKKIMFISLSLYGGGAERVVALLSNGLAEKGYEVHLVLFERKVKEYSISENVNIHVLMSSDKMNKIKELRKIIKESGVKVVIPFLAIPTEYSYIASLGLNVTFIATVRNNPQLYPSQNRKRTIVNWITRRADKIMLQTQEQSQFFSERVREKCFVISNPIKEEMLAAHFEYRDKIRRICTFGRLNKQKNHRLLIEAFAEVRKQLKNLELYIYGDGEEKDSLCGLINNLCMDDCIHLPGNTQNVCDELVKNDLFVLSSDYEGLPNALMEAMAVGMPCISTSCQTGPRDLIINKENGILIPTGSKSDLVNSMIYAINHINEVQAMGRKARITINDEYTIEKIVKRFEEVVLQEV